MQYWNTEMKDSIEKGISKPGCMSLSQIAAIKSVLKRAGEDPSLLCDIEGAGAVSDLEKAFANFCGTRFALTVSSGTAAIHAALLACGVKSGDEVIVTPYSWPQSVSPVLFTGATPVFADINPFTLNMDPNSVVSLISSKTKAILPVHLFGHPADMVQLEEIARESGTVLITDAAHALGAQLNEHPIGSWGDIACFSLSRGKLVSGGEGGILATNNPEIFDRAMSLTQHPERIRRNKGPGQWNEFLGLNFRLHPLAALLALVDLNDLDRRMAHRQSIMDRFKEGLGRTEILSFQSTLTSEKPAPYGIPLTFEGGRGRETLTVNIQGFPLRCGPVRVPLHFRLKYGPVPRVPYHASQLPGSCPVSEERCQRRELWALSALDMDKITPMEAFDMGKILSNELETAVFNKSKYIDQSNFLLSFSEHLQGAE